MSGRVVGIDLGTTNSEVAALVDGRVVVLEEDGNALLPSVVGLSPEGKLLVGTEALHQAVLHPDRTIRSVKRLMGTAETIHLGDQTFTPQEISALILGALRARAERVLGEEVTGAVITVPAYFSDVQRQVTREAGRIAGLEVMRILNEPTAASLAYASSEDAASAAQTMLVYDLGGGTFDVSIVRQEQDVTEVLASHGDMHLGGDDFDQALLAHVLDDEDAAALRARVDRDAHVRARLLRATEAARCKLSSAPSAHLREDSVWVEDGVAHHLDREVCREEFEAGIAPLLEKTVASIHRALEDAGIGHDDLDGVLLAGGTTRMPAVRALLQEATGLVPSTALHPDTCVALGAGLMAARIEGRSDASVLVDVTPYTFGVRIVEFGGIVPRYHAFEPLIRRNTPLPASVTDTFGTACDHQEAARVEVFQGEDPDTRNNIPVGGFVVDGLQDVDQGNKILISLSLGVDGILEVTATEEATGRSRKVRIEGTLERLDERALADARDRVSDLLGRDKEEREIPIVVAGAAEVAALPKDLDPEIRRVVDQCRRLLVAMEDEDRELAEALLADLVDPAKQGEIAATRERLEDLLFYVGEGGG